MLDGEVGSWDALHIEDVEHYTVCMPQACPPSDRIGRQAQQGIVLRITSALKSMWVFAAHYGFRHLTVPHLKLAMVDAGLPLGRGATEISMVKAFN